MSDPVIATLLPSSTVEYARIPQQSPQRSPPLYGFEDHIARFTYKQSQLKQTSTLNAITFESHPDNTQHHATLAEHPLKLKISIPLTLDFLAGALAAYRTRARAALRAQNALRAIE